MAIRTADDTGIISVVLPNIGTDLGHELNDIETEWITTTLSVGALVGALAGGVLADRWGRKPALLVGDAWFAAGAVLVCAASSVPVMLAGRAVLGVGVGVASAVAPVYIAEAAPAARRASLTSVQAVAITSGQVVAYAVGAALAGRPAGWRWMFAAGLLPAIAQAAAAHWLPESPRFELMAGRVERARATLARIAGRDTDDPAVQRSLDSLSGAVAAAREMRERRSLLSQLWLVGADPRLRRPAITACGLCLFQQLCGFNSLMYYSGTIFKYIGFDQSALAGLIVAGTNAAFTVCSLYIVERVGKRRILLLTFPCMTVGLALAAYSFAEMTRSTGFRLVDGSEYPHVWVSAMLGMMVFFIATYATGIGNIAWQGNEMFPLAFRGLGSSLLSGCIWVANIVVASSFLSIMNAIGPAGAYGLYAVVFFYPELSGLSLEEVTEVFADKMPVRKAREILGRLETTEMGGGTSRRGSDDSLIQE
ncbi:myo-inositol transporter [Cladochytrium tenue]|nr:myo-inositol transporter [Cladochytrium tenue]